MHAQGSTATPIPVDSELLLMQYECEWFTLESGMPMETPVTCVKQCIGLVYYRGCDGVGDYIDICHNVQ